MPRTKNANVGPSSSRRPSSSRPSSSRPSRARSPTPPPPDFDQTRFLSKAHYDFFCVHINPRKECKDKGVVLKARECPEVKALIDRRGWGTFVNRPPIHASIDLIKEFYANAHRVQGDERPRYTTMVRGREISFSPDTIRALYSLAPVASCWYSEKIRIVDLFLEEIREELCTPESEWHPGRNGQPSCLRRRSVKLGISRFVCAFVNSNLIPQNHQTDIQKNRAMLAYAILIDKPVNVGTIIADTIARLASGGGKKGCLAFPYIIQTLIDRHRIPSPPGHHILLNAVYNAQAITDLFQGRSTVGDPEATRPRRDDPKPSVAAVYAMACELRDSQQRMWEHQQRMEARNEAFYARYALDHNLDPSTFQPLHAVSPLQSAPADDQLVNVESEESSEAAASDDDENGEEDDAEDMDEDEAEDEEDYGEEAEDAISEDED